MGGGRQKKVDDRQRKGRHEMGTMRWGQETGDEVQETGERVREKGSGRRGRKIEIKIQTLI